MTALLEVLSILATVVLSAWAYILSGVIVLRWVDLWLQIDHDDEAISLILLMVWPAFVAKVIYWRIFGPPEVE